MKCPLCESDSSDKLEVLDKKDLVSLYKKEFSIDCDHLIDEKLELHQCQKCLLKYYHPFQPGDEKFYNALQKNDWYYMSEKPEYAETSKYITSSDSVLDVGSGKGAFAKNISSKKFVGLELSDGAVEMAKKRGTVVQNRTIEDYARENPGSIDVVTSFQVLEHVVNPKYFLQAKIDTLKIGGKMIIAVPSEDSFLKYVTNGILNMPPHHMTRWTDDTLRSIAEQYDLKLLNIHHEKMQEVHKLWYISTFLQNSLIHQKILDTSILRKIISGLSHFFSKFLLRGFGGELFPRGHTVIAVYEKK